MEFELIVAMNLRGIIGQHNKIPWHVPEDLTYFSKITKNSIIVMGRKTYDSLPNGPLANRINIVLSREPSETLDKNVIFTNINSIFTILEKYKNSGMKIFIIGGSEIYKLFFHMCNTLHITNIYNSIDINDDTCFFPYNMELVEEYYDKINESDLLYSKSENISYKFLTFRRKTS